MSQAVSQHYLSKNVDHVAADNSEMVSNWFLKCEFAKGLAHKREETELK